MNIPAVESITLESPRTSGTLAPSDTIRIYDSGNIPSMAEGVRNGVLDMRNYYSSADAAQSWKRVVNWPQYSMYDDCRTALLALVRSAEFLQIASSDRPNSIVMLAGGGSPTKDLVLANSLLAIEPALASRVVVIIVDIGFYMLTQSMAFLNENKLAVADDERLRFEYVQADILNLQRDSFYRVGLPVRNAPTVFAITGGTFGNLSEVRFFISLNSVSRPGDLLIIGADTIDGMPTDALRTKLDRKYRGKEMLNFVERGVAAVIHERRWRTTVEEALKRVAPVVIPVKDQALSDIPGSWNVSLILNMVPPSVTLLSSTRYQVSSLIRFAELHGWQHVVNIASPGDKRYRQFLFKRKMLEDSERKPASVETPEHT